MFPFVLFTLVAGGFFLLGIVLPFIVIALESMRKGQPLKEAPISPEASLEVIVPAYLEASEVGETIRALRQQLAVWRGPTSITIVASDEQTALASVTADRVLRSSRDGKPSAVNLGVRASEAEIILLMDANCRLGPDSWPDLLHDRLLKWRLVSANKNELGGPEGAFWKFESLAKRVVPPSVGSLAVMGEFLAFRRSDFRPIPPGTQLDDFWMAADFSRRSLAVGVAPEIFSHEKPSVARDQWERRVRMASGQLSEVLPRVPELCRTQAGRILLSHKVYRSTVGVIAFWLAVAGASLIWPPYSILLWIPVTAAVAQYAGVLRMNTFLDPLCAVIGMQAVPFFGAVRAARRSRKGTASVGWRKVSR